MQTSVCFAATPRQRLSAYLARVKSYFNGWDLALQYNYYLKTRVDWETLNSEEALLALAQRASFDDFTREFRWHLIGGEFSGELFGWALYGEVGTLEDAAQDHERVLSGLDHTFDSQVYVLVEYLRLGQGRTNSSVAFPILSVICANFPCMRLSAATTPALC